MDADRGSTFSDDNGRDTPKETFELPTRADTPGPMPNYIYSREKLMELSTAKSSRRRPNCLSEDFNTSDGLWDPERWFRSFDLSRGNSPMTISDKKRPPELDREFLSRRRPSDPKERLKEDKDGIILSPQRRSFGTGCHVSSHLPPGRQISIPGQENGDRDRERNPRRIGSGRIQIDRDRDRDREPPRERGERDFRSIRDHRFDDRERDRRFDRENRGFGRRDYDDNRRDYRDYNRHRRHSYRHNDEDEPEWFTEGPTSQRDTIELHGFEKDKRRSKTPEKVAEEGEFEASESGQNKEEPEVLEKDSKFKHHERVTEKEDYDLEEPAAVANVNDRNGSLETNEPSSPEESNNSDSLNAPSPHSNIFDFNEFFKIENIPGLAEGTSPTLELAGGIQSRFSQWFGGNARNDSRRSSINDDFGYLNDLLSGSKSPVIPSPPPPSASSFFNQSVFSTSANSTFADKPQHQSFDFSAAHKNTIAPMLNALFQNNQEKPIRASTGSISAQDAEAQLKALLFGRKGSTPSSSGTGSPAVASPLNLPGGKMKTVAELEADMKHPSSTQNFTPSSAPMQHPLTQQNIRPKVQEHPQVVHHHHVPQPRPQTPRESGQEEDLTAFNKLLSLMKAGAAAAVESPKLPANVPLQEHRPVSPNFQPPPPPPSQILTPTTPSMAQNIAQNEFLQALLRNKEQQLQIRHQTLTQMRGSQHVAKQSTPIAQPLPVNSPSLSLHQQQQALTSTSQQPMLPQSSSQLPQSNADPILNFIKQNPTIITKPSTPTPPPQQQAPPPQLCQQPIPSVPGQQQIIGFTQNTSTPRAPSPSPQLVQQNLLPQPSSPRVASPIMFSQQPPMHLSAPSPIHPSQLGGKTTPASMSSATTLSSTATIRPPVVPRVPSPQELIAHTQAIMQTALLKKQLEDQKERFMKKQQERAKSPNLIISQVKQQQPMQHIPQQQQMSVPQPQTPISSPALAAMSISPMNQPPPSQSTSKPSVTVAFTPTSVIRKMHSDKASEKEKQKQDGSDIDTPATKPPVKQIFNADGSLRDENNGDQNKFIEGSRMNEEASREEDALINHLRTSQAYQGNFVPGMGPAGQSPGIPNNVVASMYAHNAAVNQMPHTSAGLPPPVTTVMANQGPPQMNRTLSQEPITEQMAALQAMMANDRLKQTRPLMGQPVVPGGIPVPVSAPGRPIVKVGSVGVTMTTPSQGQVTKLGIGMSPQLSTPLAKQEQQMQQQRAIIGTGGTPISTGTPNVDLTKLLQQRQVNISPNPLTRPPIGGTPVTPGIPMGIPITGRVPLQPPASMSPNPLIMQQMMQGGISPAARLTTLNQINQINQLNHLALQAQQQQRMVDPRLQGMRGVYPAAVPGLSPRSMATSGLTVPSATSVAISRAISPHSLGQKSVMNGPISPGISSPINGNNNVTKQNDPNLLKWFGTDVLQTPLPNMPPLPAQGQKVMTVDEIERHQQMVSN